MISCYTANHLWYKLILLLIRCFLLLVSYSTLVIKYLYCKVTFISPRASLGAAFTR